jgi:23S rRNA (adenine2503-C2)-methyltransferase
VWKWLYVQGVSEWTAMTNVPAMLRDGLAGELAIDPAIPLRSAQASGTRKIVVRLRDGETVEEVLIPYQPERRGSEGAAEWTLCVSSQVGCKFHCAFCASGQAGFRRNLEAGEIVGQFLTAWRVGEQRPCRVVFMGIGEPLDNYDAVLKAVRILHDPDGLNVGARRITLSTCGWVPGIRRLAGEGLQIELSVSLHAPDDELRSRLMPVNRAHPLDALLAACRDYAQQTKRIITFEYVLVRDLNDSPEQARKLASLLAPLPCRVNLIPLSPVVEFPGVPSGREAAMRFVRTLGRAGINATVRASKGASLKAACGQLRASIGGNPCP